MTKCASLDLKSFFFKFLFSFSMFSKSFNRMTDTRSSMHLLFSLTADDLIIYLSCTSCSHSSFYTKKIEHVVDHQKNKWSKWSNHSQLFHTHIFLLLVTIVSKWNLDLHTRLSWMKCKSRCHQSLQKHLSHNQWISLIDMSAWSYYSSNSSAFAISKAELCSCSWDLSSILNQSER